MSDIIKKTLKSLAIRFLLETNNSIIIGYEINGDVKPKYPNQYLYQNDISGRVLDMFGREWDIPGGKFNLTRDNPDISKAEDDTLP